MKYQLRSYKYPQVAQNYDTRRWYYGKISRNQLSKLKLCLPFFFGSNKHSNVTSFDRRTLITYLIEDGDSEEVQCSDGNSIAAGGKVLL